MAKRKTKIETAAEETPVERAHKAGGQAEVVSGERWHILYTPQWRAQISDSTDKLKSLADAKQYALDMVFVCVNQACGLPHVTPAFNWQQIDTDTWIATGNDGVEETTLPLVTITRVGGAS